MHSLEFLLALVTLTLGALEVKEKTSANEKKARNNGWCERKCIIHLPENILFSYISLRNCIKNSKGSLRSSVNLKALLLNPICSRFINKSSQKKLNENLYKRSDISLFELYTVNSYNKNISIHNKSKDGKAKLDQLTFRVSFLTNVVRTDFTWWFLNSNLL